MQIAVGEPLRKARHALVPAVVLALVLVPAGDLAHLSQRMTAGPPAGVRVVADAPRSAQGASLASTATVPAALEVGAAVNPWSSAGDAAAALYLAYTAAVRVAPASCHLPVSLLAAVGQAESGPLVDVAVGPTALTAAAASTARSLCAHGRDLARPADLRSALRDRVASRAYVRLVLTLLARFVRAGLDQLLATTPLLAPLLLLDARPTPLHRPLTGSPQGRHRTAPAREGRPDGRVLLAPPGPVRSVPVRPATAGGGPSGAWAGPAPVAGVPDPAPEAGSAQESPVPDVTPRERLDESRTSTVQDVPGPEEPGTAGQPCPSPEPNAPTTAPLRQTEPSPSPSPSPSPDATTVGIDTNLEPAADGTERCSAETAPEAPTLTATSEASDQPAELPVTADPEPARLTEPAQP